jgi:phospholipase D1/2
MTMQMMYEIIYKALKEVGLDGTYEPQDYLNFFCLGNREAEDTTCTSSGPFSASNPQVRLQTIVLFSAADSGTL